MANLKDEKAVPDAGNDIHEAPQEGMIERNALLNASGHVQELDRNFNLVSLAGVGLVVGNVWPALGGSILVAIFNGGPPGMRNLT